MTTGGNLNRRTALRGLAGVGLALGAGLASAAPARAYGVPIASCDTWGARPPASAPTVLDSRPVRILIHHTATDNTTDYSQAQAYSLARWIQDLHMDTNGWIDTGQHFTNSRGGFLMEGRHQSLAALNNGYQMVVGAHCPGQNSTAIGIENEGNYTDVDPPVDLWQSLVSLCAYVCNQYAIPPTEIYGHRDYLSTTVCPGDHLYALLPQLRQQVASVTY